MTAEISSSIELPPENKKFWRQHALAFIFSGLIIIHWIGVYSTTGLQYIFAINTFSIFILLTYISITILFLDIFNIFAGKIFFVGSIIRKSTRLLFAIDLFVILFPIFYFSMAGYAPIVKMYFTDDYMASSEIRHIFLHRYLLG